MSRRNKEDLAKLKEIVTVDLSDAKSCLNVAIRKLEGLACTEKLQYDLRYAYNRLDIIASRIKYERHN